MFSVQIIEGLPKKICKECSQEKFIYEFSPSKPKCKECQAQRQREYRKKLGGDPGKRWNRFVFGKSVPSEIRALCSPNKA